VTADHATVARAVARDSIILLKNKGKTLPLGRPESLAIIGSDAIVNPGGPNACSDRSCNNGTLAMGWGSGTAEFPVSPQTQATERLKLIN
jgi:beta-glucosidase